MDEASRQLLVVKCVRPGAVYQLQHEGTRDMARGLAYYLMDGGRQACEHMTPSRRCLRGCHRSFRPAWPVASLWFMPGRGLVPGACDGGERIVAS
jgi:hypothetical protein